MNFKSRYINLTIALAIVSVVAAQVPASSVALADDTCGAGGLFTLKGGNGIALGTILVGAGYAGIVGTGAAAGAAAGGPLLSGALFGSKPIYEILDTNPSLGSIARIVRNAELVTEYSAEGPYTVFVPASEASAASLESLSKTPNQGQARAYLNSITVRGVYNRARLMDVAKAGGFLPTLGGQALTVKLVGDRLMVNGVEVVEDFPASNGWVVTTSSALPPQ